MILFFISACACHVPGVNRSADSSQCDGVTGQCACKSHVTGRACDTCQDTYWKLSVSSEVGCEGRFNLKPTVRMMFVHCSCSVPEVLSLLFCMKLFTDIAF